MTDQELKDIVATAVQALTRSKEETDRQLRELGKQLGGLGEKFGSFTEGMAYPSMKKILTEEFHMSFVAPSVLRRQNGRALELDVLAYSNAGISEAYVVEVKSHLRPEAIEQIKGTLRQFREFFPEHADKKVYGILAGVHIPEGLREKVLSEGIYLAKIHDGQFELEVPRNFEPRAF
jgi:hypothetical protein